ncbi:hypothetical protein MNBD_NITROSPINAE01-44, partial [hydrothermal vent metagenome]
MKTGFVVCRVFTLAVALIAMLS